MCLSVKFASVPLASIALKTFQFIIRERNAQKIIHSSKILERALGAGKD
jgi:hypothetical protein